ncbi:MAG: hypothetical protein GWN58_33235 [Anaerolineae bacterium]|nr:hypothetical protein [Thermoplasmata archaeon]NIV34140.1 hypothetical protein [Anaerolineae bacterium]NIY05991.1 hypothetical protein [Thermoplasmata archaeon]
MARRSVRCDIKNARTGQLCRCFIDRDNAYLHDHLGFTGPACCENHYKVLRRGKTVTDKHGRIYKLDMSGAYYVAVQVNRTPAAGDDDG